MTFEEFIVETKKAKGSKEKRVRDSYGVKCAFQEMRKNKWKNCKRAVTEKEFYAIIKAVHTVYAEALLNGEDVFFPYRMGRLSIAKHPANTYVNDKGELIVKKPINWNETLKLWYEDGESKNKKVLIRHDVSDVYHIRYNHWSGNAKNKQFFKFAPCRSLKIALKNKIKSGELTDVYSYGKIY